MVNNPLIRPSFLGEGGIGGVPLDSHDFLNSQLRRRSLTMTTWKNILLNQFSLSQWTLKKKGLNFIFPTKYVIPKSLKFSHWLSENFASLKIDFLLAHRCNKHRPSQRLPETESNLYAGKEEIRVGHLRVSNMFIILMGPGTWPRI